jgi:hypothetical protein
MARLTLLLATILIAQTAHSQIINIESSRMQTDTIRKAGTLNFSLSFNENNNNQLFQVKGAGVMQFKSKSLKEVVLILASGDLSRSGGNQFTNAGFLHVRYNHKFSKLFRWEVFQQAQYNQVLGFQFRSLTGTGPRFKWLRKDNAFSYFGALYMYEYEEPASTDNPVERSHRISTYLTFTIKVPKIGMEVVSTTYFQPDLAERGDFRVLNESSLEFSITKKLAIRTTFSFLYDGKPVNDISPRAYNLSQGFSLSL